MSGIGASRFPHVWSFLFIPPGEYEQQDPIVFYRSSYLDSDANTCSHSLAAIQISGRAAISRISRSA